MRDPDRIDKMVELLRQRWREVPDWRLGQLVVNVADRSDPFYIEDDTMTDALQELLHDA